MSGAASAGGTGSGGGEAAIGLGGATGASSGAEAGSVAADIQSMLGQIGNSSKSEAGKNAKAEASDEPIQEAAEESVDESSEPQEGESDESEEGQQEEEASEEGEADDSKAELLEMVRAMREELKELREAQNKGSSEEAKPQLVELVNDDSFAEFVSSADGLNKFGNHVMETTRQRLLQEMQPIITNEATRIATIFEYNRLFYANNKDLTGKEQTVQEVFKELLAKNPKITISDLFTKGAKEARRRIGRVSQANQKANPPAGFVQKHGGGKAPTPGKSVKPSMKQEIADLLSTK